MHRIQNSKPKKPNPKLIIVISIIILVAIIATANITIFNKPVSNIGNSSASTQEPADLNSDNKVDIVDLSILLSDWDKTDTASDLNSDDTVDIVDLSILLSAWGIVSVGGGYDPPFNDESLWNQPLPANASWRDEPMLRADHWWVNNEEYSIPVIRAKNTDPLVNVSTPASWGWPAANIQLHVPDGVSGAQGTDGSLVIISDDIVYSFWQFNRTSSNTASVSSYGKAHIENDTGWGNVDPFRSAGIRAAGASLLGGLITGEEIENGKFESALAVSMLPSILKSGWIPPAISEDAGNDYSGTIPMGSRIGIPMDTVKPSSLSSIGSMVWDCLKEYGAYVVDQHYGNSPIILYADPNSVDIKIADDLRIWWGDGDDLDQIMPFVRVLEQ